MSHPLNVSAPAARIAEGLAFVTSIFPKSRRDKMLARLDATAAGELTITCIEAGNGHAVEASAVVADAIVSTPGAAMVLTARRLARFVEEAHADTITFDSLGARGLLVQTIRDFESGPSMVTSSQSFPARDYLGSSPHPFAHDDPVVTLPSSPFAHALGYAHRAQGPDLDPYNWTFWLTTAPTPSGMRAAACSGLVAACAFAEEENAAALEPFAHSPGAVRGLLAMCAATRTVSGTLGELAVRDREDGSLWPWRQFTTRGAQGAALRLQCRKGTLFPEAHLPLIAPPKDVTSRVEVSGLAFAALVSAVTDGVKMKEATIITIEAGAEEGLALSCTPFANEVARRSTLPCKVSSPFRGTLPLALLRTVFPAASRRDFKRVLEYIRGARGAERHTLRVTRADTLDATIVRLGA